MMFKTTNPLVHVPMSRDAKHAASILVLGARKFSTHNNASGSMFPQSLVRRNDIGGCASFGLLIGHVIM